MKGTSVKAWKDTKTGEVKTFVEWIETTVVEEMKYFQIQKIKLNFI
ncbi:MAG: hypothetical protein II258_08155 [Spirochaetales bacterium]|jgi:hypothetical protein|nr:hypothetical protein [Spirochaetales bacterium]